MEIAGWWAHNGKRRDDVVAMEDSGGCGNGGKCLLLVWELSEWEGFAVKGNLRCSLSNNRVQ
jgi:hypothetical protein